MYILYVLVLAALSIYSYGLMDTNITLFNAPAWTQFRNTMIQLGYFQRTWSALIYVILLGLLCLCHWYYIRVKHPPVKKITLTIAVIAFLGYPFLSHDLFNYIFDARIFTHYHMNPYLKTALDFPADPMTRFMHWTHRTYPYGPVFLILTLIPSFMSLGKFLLGYLFFRLMSVVSYLVTIYYLNRWNPKYAIFAATSPLMIIEGIMNNHNDLIALALGIVGLFYVYHKRPTVGRIVLILSAAIKYTTLPLLIVTNSAKSIYTRLAVVGIAILVVYMTFGRTVEIWYYLTPYVLLPIGYNHIRRYGFFMFGVLASYTDYIWQGVWRAPVIYGCIVGSFVINFLYNWFNDLHNSRRTTAS